MITYAGVGSGEKLTSAIFYICWNPANSPFTEIGQASFCRSHFNQMDRLPFEQRSRMSWKVAVGTGSMKSPYIMTTKKTAQI